MHSIPVARSADLADWSTAAEGPAGRPQERDGNRAGRGAAARPVPALRPGNPVRQDLTVLSRTISR